MAYSTAALVLVLAGVATTLGGCGSSSDSGGNAPLPPAAAKPLDFVSQTIESTIDLKFNVVTGMNLSATAKDDVKLYVDADTLSIRADSSDGKAVVEIFGNPANVTIVEGVIFSFASKRVTAKYNVSLAGGITLANCTYMDIKKIPSGDPKTYKDLIEGFIKTLATTRADDGYNRHMQTLDPGMLNKQLSGKVDIAIEEDDNALFRKISVDADVKNATQKGAQPNTAHVNMTSTKVTAGAPDASVFDVPKDWKCFPAPAPGPGVEDFGLPQEAVLSRMFFQLADMVPFEKLQAKSEAQTLIAI